MRLGQLARKLSVRTAEITDFLAQHNIKIEEGSNVRLQEEQVELIVKHFNAENAAFFLIPKNESEEQPNVVEIVTETIEIDTVPQVLIEPDPVKEVEPEKGEVIRAPKVELSGLRVLGKIDLPEKRKKEPDSGSLPEQPGTVENEKKDTRPARRPHHQKNTIQKPYKNPVTLQREREARETEKMKRDKQQQEKDKRTQHYQRRVKSTPTKPVRKVEEPLQEIKETETTGQLSRWKRFIRWWNT